MQDHKLPIRKIKIFEIIIIALMLTISLTPRIFIANSPKINPNFFADLKNIQKNFYALIQTNNSHTDALSAIPTVVPPPNLLFKTVARGIQAAEDPATGDRYMKIVDGTQVKVRTFKLKDGRVIKIITPVD
jgi:hypothetical protein